MRDPSRSRRSTFEAMQILLHQEQSGHNVVDFLGNLPDETNAGESVDAEARRAIAAWCFKIMETCGYRRETARIAMAYLDRYVSSQIGASALLDRKEFKLLSLSCVYTAIKVNERYALASYLISKLSNGERTAGEVETMERKLLQVLEWRMHVPTAADFLHAQLARVPSAMISEKDRQTIVELADYQLDASVLNYNFCCTKQSSVAIASLLNAVQTISNDGSVLCHFESLVADLPEDQRDAVGRLREELFDTISDKSNRPRAACSQSIRMPHRSENTILSMQDGSYSSSPRTVQLS